MKLFKWRYKYNNKGIITRGAFSLYNGMGFHISSNLTLLIHLTENKPLITITDEKDIDENLPKLKRVIISILISILVSILLFRIEYSGIKKVYLELNNYYFKYIILAILIGLFTGIINLIRIFVLIGLWTSPSTKSTHSAEHMMINFLNQFGQLPKNINELKKSSRISTNCGTKDSFKDFFISVLSVTLSSCLSGILLNLVQICNNQINSDQLFLLYALFIVIVYAFMFSYFSKIDYINKIDLKLCYILSPIGQLFTTSAIIPEEKITLAFAVGTLWFKIRYLSQFSKQDIAQWDELLKKYKLDIILKIPIFTKEEFKNSQYYDPNLK